MCGSGSVSGGGVCGGGVRGGGVSGGGVRGGGVRGGGVSGRGVSGGGMSGGVVAIDPAVLLVGRPGSEGGCGASFVVNCLMCCLCLLCVVWKRYKCESARHHTTKAEKAKLKSALSPAPGGRSRSDSTVRRCKQMRQPSRRRIRPSGRAFGLPADALCSSPARSAVRRPLCVPSASPWLRCVLMPPSRRGAILYFCRAALHARGTVPGACASVVPRA